jgi:S1-C subfamily serine protease
MYTGEDGGRLVVNGLAEGAPAARAGVRVGDIVAAVAGDRVGSLAEFYRAVWRRGPAGTAVPLTLYRGSVPVQVDVRSRDRNEFLKKPSLQ